LIAIHRLADVTVDCLGQADVLDQLYFLAVGDQPFFSSSADLVRWDRRTIRIPSSAPIPVQSAAGGM
jgi:hypothetical protein